MIDVQTLTAEVRVLTIGTQQLTRSMARQLDRLDCYCVDPTAITPFGRVRTGATTQLERKLLRRPKKVIDSKHYDCDGEWFESYTAAPWLEVIGVSQLDENKGALVIYEVGNQYEFRQEFSDDQDVIDTVTAWSKMPLIVLAGSR